MRTCGFPHSLLRAWGSPFDWLTLEARVHWISVDIDTVEGTYLDLFAAATWMVIDHVGITAGWRQTDYDIDAEIDDEELGTLDFGLGGPFWGGTIQF